MTRLVPYAAAVVAVLVVLGIAHRAGSDAEADAVTRQNQAAEDHADEADRALADCHAAGGLYDFATGQCAGAE